MSVERVRSEGVDMGAGEAGGGEGGGQRGCRHLVRRLPREVDPAVLGAVRDGRVVLDAAVPRHHPVAEELLRGIDASRVEHG